MGSFWKTVMVIPNLKISTDNKGNTKQLTSILTSNSTGFSVIETEILE